MDELRSDQIASLRSDVNEIKADNKVRDKTIIRIALYNEIIVKVFGAALLFMVAKDSEMLKAVFGGLLK